MPRRPPPPAIGPDPDDVAPDLVPAEAVRAWERATLIATSGHRIAREWAAPWTTADEAIADAAARHAEARPTAGTRARTWPCGWTAGCWRSSSRARAGRS